MPYSLVNKQKNNRKHNQNKVYTYVGTESSKEISEKGPKVEKKFESIFCCSTLFEIAGLLEFTAQRHYALLTLCCISTSTFLITLCNFKFNALIV